MVIYDKPGFPGCQEKNNPVLEINNPVLEINVPVLEKNNPVLENKFFSTEGKNSDPRKCLRV
jgi:hypothetical protein